MPSRDTVFIEIRIPGSIDRGRVATNFGLTREMKVVNIHKEGALSTSYFNRKVS